MESSCQTGLKGTRAELSEGQQRAPLRSKRTTSQDWILYRYFPNTCYCDCLREHLGNNKDMILDVLEAVLFSLVAAGVGERVVRQIISGIVLSFHQLNLGIVILKLKTNVLDACRSLSFRLLHHVLQWLWVNEMYELTSLQKNL